MDIKIVFHPSGDWEGLYINGNLEEEDHSIQVEDLVTALNKYKAEDMKGVFSYSTRDLGNEEGFDAEDFSFPLKYGDIKV